MSALINEEGAAKLLTIKPKTLQAWRVNGGGPPFIKIGRCVRYRTKDLDEFMRGGLRKSTSEYTKHQTTAA